ncbi:DUF2589 domain-containing protein [Parabacteroides merdae]|uniref:DUF2589 domain-containing protein n=1 Tax=Parabacteroides merdae TaxID=46503 RepID=UPI0018976DEB|nr:DUF2589 domain-containing protein [Parabacteroides merdae]MDB8920542.1 DUF2589 domain-containing protein [Parabacteroides merdae]
MGIFVKKKTYAFSDIIRGLQQAVSGAHEMLQARQVQSLMKFWQTNDGKPLTQKIQVGDKEMEVPLFALVSQSNMEMDEVNISFKTKIGDVAMHSIADKLHGNQTLSHADLQMEMDGIKADDDDVMQINIRFKVKETPEGVARLTDEYNKQI